jgi:hypothetical protein
MKKFKSIEKLQTSKLKKAQLSLIAGGECSCGTLSMCMADGAIEPSDWDNRTV